MLHYDADSYLSALEPPTYTHHQCVYHGRVLSFDQWVALTHHVDYLAKFLRVIAPGDDVAAVRGYVQFRVSMRRIVDAVFPRGCKVTRPKDVPLPMRGWIVKRPARVSDLIEELPLEARSDAVRSFIRSQERIQKPSAETGETTTTKTTSTPLTPPPMPIGSASASPLASPEVATI